MSDGFKICTKCNTEKTLSDFYKSKDCKHGVSSICKICQNSYMKDYLKEYVKANNYKSQYKYAKLHPLQV